MDLKHPCSIKKILVPQCLPAPSHPSLHGPLLGPRVEPLHVCNKDTPVQAQARPLSLAGRLEVGRKEGMRPAHTSVRRVDGTVGLGALGIHELAAYEELVGHLESPLVHCLFHLGRKAQLQWVAHTQASVSHACPEPHWRM